MADPRAACSVGPGRRARLLDKQTVIETFFFGQARQIWRTNLPLSRIRITVRLSPQASRFLSSFFKPSVSFPHRFDFPPPPRTAPGSPTMLFTKCGRGVVFRVTEFGLPQVEIFLKIFFCLFNILN